MEWDVFVSYATEEDALARKVVEPLRAAGYRVFFAPDSIPAGEIWDEVIPEAIEASKLMVVVLTAASNTAAFVKDEVSYARDFKKTIIPLRFGENIPTRRMKFRIGSVNYIDTSEADLQAGVDRLLKNVKRHFPDTHPSSSHQQENVSPPPPREPVLLREDTVPLDAEGSTYPVFGSAYHRVQIRSITFRSSLAGSPPGAFDVSAAGDRSALGWVEKNGELYDLTIAAEGGLRAPESCSRLFRGYSELEEIHWNHAFDTTGVEIMFELFRGCSSLTKLDLSSFHTKHVSNMAGMFWNCSNLTRLDLSGFDSSQVTDMGGMFTCCSSLSSLDLSSFNTAQVKNMNSMFWACSSLTSLDLFGFNTARVTDMGGMFALCSSLTSLDLSSFDTAQVEKMHRMFLNCSSLTKLDLSSFDTTRVKEKSEMFSGCPSSLIKHTGERWTLGNQNYAATEQKPPAQQLPNKKPEKSITREPVLLREDTVPSDAAGSVFGSAYKRGQIRSITFRSSLAGSPPEAFDVSAAGDRSALGWVERSGELYDLTIAAEGGLRAPKSCRSLFRGYTKLETIHWNNAFDTTGVTDMRSMFYDCFRLTSLDLSRFDTAQVADMYRMFSDCSSLTSLDLSRFDTARVTNMSGMFRGCSRLTSLDLSRFDTARVADMRWMFYGCSSLTSLDLSRFDTARVTNMHWMFVGCFRLTSLDLSRFDTARVTDMSWMFDGCFSLTSLDLSRFDTARVADMRGMFSGCSGLTSLDLSRFDTARVTDMRWMFSGCSSLTSLDLSRFDTARVTDRDEMFWGCSYSLTVRTGAKWALGDWRKFT